MITKVESELREFVREGRAILGICNGFQVLVESGLIPGLSSVQVSLTVNTSARYECRWVYLKHVNNGKCLLTREVPKDRALRIPIGHGEGRFIVSNEDSLKEIVNNDLIVFKYVRPDGSEADGEYPYNPNGSIMDIAGICNIDGNVLGMMPHPERAFFKWQLPDWTRTSSAEGYGDGYYVIESIVKYIEKKF